MIYHGEFIRYLVQFGNASLIVKQIRHQGSYLPTTGDHVALNWSAEDVLVFGVESQK